MWKFARQIAMAMLAVLILAAALILCLSADAQSVTGRKWVVVMKMKPPKDNPLQEQYELRFNLIVDGATEGEAAINAHKHLSELLTTTAAERLVFLEAQQRK